MIEKGVNVTDKMCVWEVREEAIVNNVYVMFAQ